VREKADQPAAGVLFDLGPHVIVRRWFVWRAEVDYGVGLFQRETLRWMIPSMFCLEYPDCAPWAGRDHCVCAGAAFFLIHGTKGSFVKVWNGSAGGAAAGRSNILKAQIGVRIGVKKRKSCGAH